MPNVTKVLVGCVAAHVTLSCACLRDSELRRASIELSHCKEQDIQVYDVDDRDESIAWTAACHGRRLRCSRKTEGLRTSVTSCTPVDDPTASMSEKITPRHLERKALIYVRQSSPQQVTHNLESKRLQYAMRARISELGWRQIEVIDEDLGRTANGTVERTGFDRMVAEVCLGQVGAVAAGEVSRFARNSRDWHQLIEMCSLVSSLRPRSPISTPTVMTTW
ncbi:MAG: recombinase family protein [Polyangiaceae bacterium]|nr:recombinase family protein [Polyangiaceae bacterium]